MRRDIKLNLKYLIHDVVIGATLPVFYAFNLVFFCLYVLPAIIGLMWLYAAPPRVESKYYRYIPSLLTAGLVACCLASYMMSGVIITSSIIATLGMISAVFAAIAVLVGPYYRENYFRVLFYFENNPQAVFSGQEQELIAYKDYYKVIEPDHIKAAKELDELINAWKNEDEEKAQQIINNASESDKGQWLTHFICRRQLIEFKMLLPAISNKGWIPSQILSIFSALIRPINPRARPEILRAMLEYFYSETPHDINEKIVINKTILDVALEKDDLELTSILLFLGADPTKLIESNQQLFKQKIHDVSWRPRLLARYKELLTMPMNCPEETLVEIAARDYSHRIQEDPSLLERIRPQLPPEKVNHIVNMPAEERRKKKERLMFTRWNTGIKMCDEHLELTGLERIEINSNRRSLV